MAQGREARGPGRKEPAQPGQRDFVSGEAEHTVKDDAAPRHQAPARAEGRRAELGLQTRPREEAGQPSPRKSDRT